MKRFGVNIVTLAEKSNVSRNQISRILGGSGTRSTTLTKLVNAFDQMRPKEARRAFKRPSPGKTEAAAA